MHPVEYYTAIFKNEEFALRTNMKRFQGHIFKEIKKQGAEYTVGYLLYGKVVKNIYSNFSILA